MDIPRVDVGSDQSLLDIHRSAGSPQVTFADIIRGEGAVFGSESTGIIVFTGTLVDGTVFAACKEHPVSNSLTGEIYSDDLH